MIYWKEVLVFYGCYMIVISICYFVRKYNKVLERNLILISFEENVKE